MALTQLKTGAIADDAVTTDKLANAINTERTANTAKSTNATHTGEVTGSGALTIANDAVTSAKIADDAIVAAAIADNAVVTAAINADAVTSAKLADNAVVTATITDAAVTNAKLADDSVNGSKIAAGAINNANKLQDSIVTGAKIGSGTIVAGNLASDSVTEAKLNSDAVTTTKLADDAVTYAKIQNVSTTNRILGRDSSGAGVIEEITPANLRTMINVADGATAGGGKVLQVVQAVKTGAESFTVSGGTHDISGLTVNITPSASSSKIYIMADVGGHVHNSQGGSFLLVRTISGSASNLNTSDAASNRRVSSFTGTLYTGDGGGANDITLTANCKFLDSPNTTSEVNYKIMMQKNSGNDLYCINRTESDNDSSDETRTVSQITVMEIDA